jgi:transcriptional regulator with XRE-family HTH domain
VDLADFRAIRGYSQIDLAVALGRSRQKLQRYEAGENVPLSVKVRAAKSQKELASRDILEKWKAAGEPETMAASEFATIDKTYGKDTMSRARKAAGITTHKEPDPDNGTVDRWVRHFPESSSHA